MGTFMYMLSYFDMSACSVKLSLVNLNSKISLEFQELLQILKNIDL